MSPRIRQTTPERFWSRVEIMPGGCWLWLATADRDGYGLVALTGDTHPPRQMAHRYAYQAVVGSVPDGLVLDHLCRVRACVNPDHLEPVSISENVRRTQPHRRPRRTTRNVTDDRRVGVRPSGTNARLGASNPGASSPASNTP